VAKKYGIDRAAQEAFAVASQHKAAAAVAAGKLKDEIVPIETKAGLVDADGTPRPGTTAEALAGLKPAFSVDGTVTAGTASPLTDGAAAVLIASEDYARAHGLPILARLKSVAISGCAPEVMGIGPVEATRKALARAGIAVGDLDVVELNEAFASQSLACIADLGLDPARVNLDGGAIAIGHPLGATGARIVGKAASLLAREGGTYALATQCIGGGQGIATILEAV
jgi:acetyl-CoA acyltransferase